MKNNHMKWVGAGIGGAMIISAIYFTPIIAEKQMSNLARDAIKEHFLPLRDYIEKMENSVPSLQYPDNND